MMKKTWLHNAILNSGVAVTISILKIVVSFIGRTAFVYLMGKEYLGYNGLFTNVLTMLSLAELGIGVSLTHALYKPMAEQNYEKLSAYLRTFKIIYRWIGLIVLLLVLLLIPALPLLLGGVAVTQDILGYYLLFLLNSVVSYFFTYNRSLLIAAQRNYLIVSVDFLSFFVLSILQMIVLLVSKDYNLYLLLVVLSTIAANLIITHIVKKEPYYQQLNQSSKLTKDDVASLKKATVGNISSNIGTFFVFGTDNLLLSAAKGVVEVGIYSNYTLITSALRTIVNQIIQPLTGSLGHLIHTGTKDEVYASYRNILYINYFFSYVTSLMLYASVNNLISLWLGVGVPMF